MQRTPLSGCFPGLQGLRKHLRIFLKKAPSIYHYHQNNFVDIIVKYPPKRIKNKFCGIQKIRKNNETKPEKVFLEIVLCKSVTQIFGKIPEKFL